MDKLIIAFGPIFAAGFAVQQFTEILSPLFKKWKNQTVTSLFSLLLGFILAFWGNLRILEPLCYEGNEFWDIFVTALVISAGTEGINSIIKFLGYAKADKKTKLREGENR
ncbi:MAG: hypothetical protein U9R66_12225 [Thermodesulfobacteriota bacterium]|nr:hypothetical protein [Thermodesulfobacteriota bacterium]